MKRATRAFIAAATSTAMIAAAQPALAQEGAGEMGVTVNGEPVSVEQGEGDEVVVNVDVAADGTADSGEQDAQEQPAAEETQDTDVTVGKELDVAAMLLGLVALVAALAAGWLYFAAPVLGIELPTLNLPF
ncbi:hypothetical protein CKJ84_04640 [Corynebacterium sp. NML 120412]|uniref:hypothetical protein n=1 Tax=Corynebacterium sp. NML 120412 TaxID=2029401 RepID=UPI000BAA7C03|nr:hypothetical protein [Corynebacterium sp. NML 120412]PAT15546.1 hypothetical protein CKJ84_04640 [Corynebacterium sp. NML 120412]